MQFNIFPANFICWEYVEEHKTIKEKYFNKLQSSISQLKNDNGWHCDVTTSFGDANSNLNESIFDDFFVNNVIWKYLKSEADFI